MVWFKFIPGIFVGLTTLIVWIATGLHTGWTKTQVAIEQVDEITGIEFVVYEDRFVAGIDFLGGGFLVAGAMLMVALFFELRKRDRK